MCRPQEERPFLLDRPATRAGGMDDGSAGVVAAGPDGGAAHAPDGGVADAPDGSAADAPDGGAAHSQHDDTAAARNGGEAAERNGCRVTSGGTPPEIDRGAAGLEGLPSGEAEFGAQLGAPDGVKATRGVTVPARRRRAGQRS